MYFDLEMILNVSVTEYYNHLSICPCEINDNLKVPYYHRPVKIMIIVTSFKTNYRG